MKIFTIGGYGFTEEKFVEALLNVEVDTFLDVRQRRGMRGSRYAFLNSKRLQGILEDANIKYIHEYDLAPTTGVRDAQKLEDITNGIGKRDRARLSEGFIEKYNSEILENHDPSELRRALSGSNVVALFCVESEPSACHRSIAAQYLAQAFCSDSAVEHLKP